MLRALESIAWYRKDGAFEAVPGQEEWLRLLVSAEERIVNFERIRSIGELAKANPVLDYVETTLRVLDRLPVSFWIRDVLEEVLAWSETAKGGTLRERLRWQETGVNLFVHNQGSAELYRRYAVKNNGDTANSRFRLIHTLIETHGLVGQYIRGEAPFSENRPLHGLVEEGLLTAEELVRLLLALNECIISGVSAALWEKVQAEIAGLVEAIAYGREPRGRSLVDRLERLRTGSIHKGEDFRSEWKALSQEADMPQAFAPMADITLWYVEAALQDFSAEEFVKVLLLGIYAPGSDIRHLSFEPLMNDMYYDYKGEKKLNVYKKRMIEAYLRQLDWSSCLQGTGPYNPHLCLKAERKEQMPDTAFFTFQFSPAADKLIQFCIEAEKSPLYEKAVLMLFDLFGLRRDAYDRFHNEDSYLQDMNSSGGYKRIMLQYVTGTRVLDIGPGGGVLLDLLEEELPHVQAVGIDISANVIEALEKRKRIENRRWQVLKGDALNLSKEMPPGSVDTVIFSSILHELYSYIETEGRRFHPATVIAALKSAYDVLAPGGRIIIRDGIMTEPADQMRRIRFLEKDGMAWLKRYAEDFKGRTIRYEAVAENEVVMPVNDAMEFLYTYTWGEEAYVHEVQEQFGYFTPSEYRKVIHDTLGEEAEIIEQRHFLQEGYTEALEQRVQVMDETGKPVPLPDSTCLIVIAKPYK